MPLTLQVFDTVEGGRPQDTLTIGMRKILALGLRNVVFEANMACKFADLGNDDGTLEGPEHHTGRFSTSDACELLAKRLR